MSKAEALQKVSEDATAYALAKDNLEVKRAVLYESICAARTARATQQEIADRTAVEINGAEREGLARQRIAQIIQQAK